MKIMKKCRLNIPEEYRKSNFSKESYDNLIEPYERVCKSMENRLRQLDGNYKERNGRSPIHSIEARVKNYASIADKMQRKNLEPTCINAVNRIGDLAGVRVICFYIEEIYAIVEDIKKLKNVIVLKEKDYVKNPKGNGYRSYHMVIGSKIPTQEEATYLPVEIQIRTIGMDWWASMEHQLCYKPLDGEEEALRSDEMKRYSKRLYNLEKQMQKFYHPLEPHIDE
jgi:putative GTP pyrophosphokinase